jgi:hypothetical protein
MTGGNPIVARQDCHMVRKLDHEHADCETGRVERRHDTDTSIDRWIERSNQRTNREKTPKPNTITYAIAIHHRRTKYY